MRISAAPHCGSNEDGNAHLNKVEKYMFEGLFQPLHLIVIFAIVLLVFGPKKLPEIGKGLGESIRGFKKAIHDMDAEPKIEETKKLEDKH